MGIMDRIKLNVRANLNSMLDKAEDPQKVFDQFLMEMRDSVREVKMAVADAITGTKKIEQEIKAASEKSELWQERAILALKNENEELARKALEQKVIYMEKEKDCKAELEKQNQTVAELKASLSALETKLDELYKKRIDLIRQYTVSKAKAAQTMASRPAPSQISIDTSAFDMYDRMVENVKDMEAQADAYKALFELSETDEVNQKFRKMERDAEIEANLKAIKEKLGTGG